jgi:hypothetical protein
VVCASVNRAVNTGLAVVGGAQITQIWMASPVIVIEPMAMQNGGPVRMVSRLTATDRYCPSLWPDIADPGQGPVASRDERVAVAGGDVRIDWAERVTAAAGAGPVSVLCPWLPRRSLSGFIRTGRARSPMSEQEVPRVGWRDPVSGLCACGGRRPASVPA